MAGKKRLKKLIVDNSRWGALDGTPVYVTPSLYTKLASRPKRDGVDFLERVRRGRAIRGLKHLLESIQGLGSNARLVLTGGKTERRGSDYYVNLNDYGRRGQGRFLTVYRQAGLDVAASFLQEAFPDKFPPSTPSLTSAELRKIRHNPDQTLDELSQRQAQKRRLIKKTSEVVRELREEESALRQSIEALEELRRQSSIAFYRERIAEFKRRLGKQYPETKGRHSWQSWVYANNWLLGTQYQLPIEKEQVGFDSIPDFLFPTIDGFIDILEIKKPEHDVLRADPSHTGSFMWSSECNRAIGQVTNYIYEMELNQLLLRDRINDKYKDLLDSEVRVIRPRAFVVIGTSDTWDSTTRNAFRKLNHTLHGVVVLTYTELLQRAEQLVALFVRSKADTQ